MLLIGFINDVGFGVMLAWLSSLSSKYDRNLQFMQFGIFVQAVPILARAINAKYSIQTGHQKRMGHITIAFLFSYLILALSVFFPNENFGIPLASLACVLYQIARSFGEATIVGYMKAIP